MLTLNELTVRTRSSGATLVGPVTFDVCRGEVLGVVGESGSGKTTIGLAIARLLAPSLGIEGEILFEDKNLAAMAEKQFRTIRGRRIAMIFQDPSSALNPLFTIGQQLEAVLASREGTSASRASLRERSLEILKRVGIPDPDQRSKSYPHELSGGMCQRVVIALALATGADLIIADEATSALDVTIQSQIMDLLAKLVREENLTVVFISHDLGVVSQICDRVAVFYAGQLVELGSVSEITEKPCHPYTTRLVGAVPDLDAIGQIKRGIPGRPPVPGEMSAGCRFRDRCDLASERCLLDQSLRHIDGGRQVRCHLVAADA